MTHVGFVNKYEDREVATHLVIDGRPACGARVDRDAFETFPGSRDEVTCRRCALRRPPACWFCSHVHTEPGICRARAIDGGPCVCTQDPDSPPANEGGRDD